MNTGFLGGRTALLLCAILGLAAAAWGIPPRGSTAPDISLRDLDGTHVSTAAMAPRSLVLVFGELSHEGTRQACTDVLEVLADPRLASAHATPILIVAQDAPAADLKKRAAEGKFPALVLHDPARDAFGAYRVLVMPTVIVVNGQGKVVHAIPAYLHQSREQLTEAILTAEGQETQEAFEASLQPKAPAESHEASRADRLVHLGQELARHELYEMAEARYTEATTLVPGHLGAELGLGELMLRQDRLPEAEAVFRSALTAHPDSTDAVLGIASVQVRRGGDDASKACATVQGIIDRDPKLPRARYVMGLIRERQGDTAAAAAEFKKAAELLLDR